MEIPFDKALWMLWQIINGDPGSPSPNLPGPAKASTIKIGAF